MTRRLFRNDWPKNESCRDRWAIIISSWYAIAVFLPSPAFLPEPNKGLCQRTNEQTCMPAWCKFSSSTTTAATTKQDTALPQRLANISRIIGDSVHSVVFGQLSCLTNDGWTVGRMHCLPSWPQKFCSRAGGAPLNLSLFAAWAEKYWRTRGYAAGWFCYCLIAVGKKLEGMVGVWCAHDRLRAKTAIFHTHWCVWVTSSSWMSSYYWLDQSDSVGM